MNTQTAPAARETETAEIAHRYCGGCYPNAKLGDPVSSICGGHIGTVRPVRPLSATDSLCVVCEGLAGPHQAGDTLLACGH